MYRRSCTAESIMSRMRPLFAQHALQQDLKSACSCIGMFARRGRWNGFPEADGVLQRW